MPLWSVSKPRVARLCDSRIPSSNLADIAVKVKKEDLSQHMATDDDDDDDDDDGHGGLQRGLMQPAQT